MPTLPAEGSPKIVFLGELVAGDSIYLRAAQSNPVIQGGSYTRKPIQGLEMQVQSPEGTVWSLNHEEDDLSQQEFTLPYFYGQLLQASKTYTVKGVHPQFGTAIAVVPVPAAFNATVTDTASDTYGGQPCLKVDFTLQDLPETGNAYAIEVVQQTYFMEPAFLYNGEWLKMSDHLDLYDSLINAGETVDQRLDSFYVRNFNRVPFYTQDAFAEHVKAGRSAEQTVRALFSDAFANGSIINCHVYIPRKNIYPSVPGIYGYKTLVQIKSISADYYTYLHAYSQAAQGLDFDIFSNKVILKGNVTNGLGIVGGVFRRQFGFDL